jgi:hypothetical protein
MDRTGWKSEDLARLDTRSPAEKEAEAALERQAEEQTRVLARERFLAPASVLIPKDATEGEVLRLRYGRFGPPKGSKDAERWAELGL